VVEPIGMFVPIVRNIVLKRMYHSLLGRKLLQGAAALIATSQQEVEELAAGGVAREKIVLRRNGVEPPPAWPARGTFRTAQGISPDAMLVLFLGRLSSKKSPGLLLQAFRELPEQIEGKEVRLVFAGPDEGQQGEILKKAAGQLGVSGRVQFSGPLFGDAKWAAYRDADVFVLPSQNENFGNTAAEAIAAGTPVIVTEQCGIAPLLVDEAGLVVRHEARGVSEALLQVLNDPETRQRLKDGCAKVTERLGWSEPVGQMEGLYRGLASAETFVAESRTGETG
jgi:glycosyltransferase involved in cell wall biosynthesis